MPTQADPAPILNVHDLSVEFSTPEGIVRAVNHISLSAFPGKTLGIVGESGCGKSVSMLTVMGLIPAPPGRITSGEVWFDGEELLALPKGQLRKKRGKDLAMVFQDPMTSLNPVLTIGRQVSESMQVHLGLDDQAARQAAIHLLDMVGLPFPAERFGSYPHEFSGGMRQRVMIAMALACSPKLLIADEPTTALDVTIQAQIIELVKFLRDQSQMAIVWISHDLSVIAELADEVVVMYSGYVVEQANVFTLFQAPAHPYTRGLLNSIPRLDQTNRRLVTIPGSPPGSFTARNTPQAQGCPFASRCPSVFERCRQENPPLVPVSQTRHAAACWLVEPSTIGIPSS